MDLEAFELVILRIPANAPEWDDVEGERLLRCMARTRRSSPIAPKTWTCAPSLARSTAAPAAVPAAVARISVRRVLPWPGGIDSTERPGMSSMRAPITTTRPRSGLVVTRPTGGLVLARPGGWY
ncbi:MAG: hypothetical protein ACRDNF_08365 [Streptosporangiaceae bacterium]